MDQTRCLVPPVPAPKLNIPRSPSTVEVSIIDSTTRISIPFTTLIRPPVQDLPDLKCPSYVFLIHHRPSNQRLVFDLGVRKDWKNFAPALVRRITQNGWGVSVQKNISEILTENGVDLSSINAVIWSHQHWDHIGDPSTFPASTALIVGPGFKDAFAPGYPANPRGVIRESDYEGREFREVSFPSDDSPDLLRIGRFKAIDYFQDGSFYLLDAPGHTIGHLCALARVTDGDRQGFVLMGADAAHHAGEFRPSPYLPLPKDISPNPLEGISNSRFATGHVCPGEIFLHGDGEDGGPKRADHRFLAPAKGLSVDGEKASWTIEGLEEFDASDEVLVVLAHDSTVQGMLNFFPKGIEGQMRQDVKNKVRWRWLADFASETGGTKGERL
ncbi:metallo-beta-lactamase superfamily protein [Eremomyces bilateralis CBS 781.70]|uniref:Metallo-beta-lactamase superfamily protein n=1 Tax=Eremomyces bilateralis CBS 781.70 TaxID=1392243 RepID=A0A6G1G4S4_9PEZI|nr:metallo-beta-lactamase superfamily protein [Eremomyces bilateralis CBS 781.70]KAF1813002.1 metallo-beta-lactamase superfamily protein [Eremomyces bilateralis CBS 781.70]